MNYIAWNQFARLHGLLFKAEVFAACEVASTASKMQLHSPMPQTKAFVRLSLLDGGSFTADTDKLHAGVEHEKFRMHVWAFAISHGDKHVLWDVGLPEVEICGDNSTGSISTETLS